MFLILTHFFLFLILFVLITKIMWIRKALVKSQQELCQVSDIRRFVYLRNYFFSLVLEIPFTVKSKTWIGIKAFNVQNYLFKMIKVRLLILQRFFCKLLHSLWIIRRPTACSHRAILRLSLSFRRHLFAIPHSIYYAISEIISFKKAVSVVLFKFWLRLRLLILFINNYLLGLFNLVSLVRSWRHLFVNKCRQWLLLAISRGKYCR